MMSTKNEVRVILRKRVTCPHCWGEFAPEDTLWVAAHPDLVGDQRLTADQPQRFLPSRFNIEGNAVDVRGMPCQELACPICHLIIPRALLELPPLFVSIAGTPSCGKSYFLAAMTWMLRQTMPRFFSLSYVDADPQSNLILNQYEEQQFLNHNQDEIVKLKKTDQEGDGYDEVQFGSQTIKYPRPFLFAIRPGDSHPFASHSRRVAKLLCLYDNAGESFLPGQDTVVNPVTRHLAKSNAVMFCFDPTQDPRFRAACSGRSSDYQISKAPVTARQETVLHEIINRIRQHAGLNQTEKRRQPLIIAVTKADTWWSLLGNPNLPAPWKLIGQGKGPQCLDVELVGRVSHAVRDLLRRVTPELVAAAEGFSERTWFIPVSATGCSPEAIDRGGDVVWGVRPKDIRPMWCEVPLLTALAATTKGLITASVTPNGPGLPAEGPNHA